MKSLRFLACAAAILFAGLHGSAAFAQERIEVPWTELAPALAGKVVSTVLVDGTTLQGRVLDVLADELRFEATKTSNRDLHPKGNISLPRSQVSVFSYKERRGYWRAAGTAIGVVAGASIGALYCAKSNGCIRGFQSTSSGNLGTVAAVSIGGGGAAGYFAGRAADLHETMVVLAKE